MNGVRRSPSLALALIASLAVCGALGARERAEPTPRELEDVGVTERLGERVPLDIMLRDESGAPVRLERFFRDGRPVVLDLGYFRCPMLCGLVLGGLRDALREISLEPGEDFAVLSVSFDPAETPGLARARKRHVLEGYGRPGAAAAWHFLVGDVPEIERLTSAVGFRYRWVEERGEFAHAAALIVLTPDGRVSRYLYGVDFPARTLRLSLVEASEGTIGSAGDQLLLFCFQYDPESGRYSIAARKIMQLGAALTVVVLVSLIGSAFWREARRRRREGAPGGVA